MNKKKVLENVIETYNNGCRYEGQKKNGVRHGKGKYIYTNQGYYEGNWRANKINGTGTLYYPNK